jgi:CheY-like chemotaxis protein
MKRILFADDNGHIREYCKRAFEAEGYCIVLARDGDEAVRLAMTESFDLIILDLSMPKVGGLEAAQRIKTICPSLPIMFFTAHDEDCLPERRREIAVACVEKTDDLTGLKQMMAKVLTV